jgi:lipopolysaccharide/colanic/teichoic acid biosynthesis glycosyltransferase
MPGLTRALFALDTRPWLMAEFLAVFVLFQLGIWATSSGVGQPSGATATLGAAYATAFCALALGYGAYDWDSRFAPWKIRSASWAICLAGGALGMSVASVLSASSESLTALTTAALAGSAGVFVWRSLLSRLARTYPYRYTIYGDDEHTREAVGRLSSVPDLYVRVAWDDVFSTDPSVIADRLRSLGVCDLILASSVRDRPQIDVLQAPTVQAGCRILDGEAFYAATFNRLPLDQLSKNALTAEIVSRQHRIHSVVKRAADVVLSATALIVLSPILLGIAIAIWLSDRGPIFFNQVRQGQDCRPFTMYKFRTMHPSPPSSTTEGFTQEHDARITSIGRALRSTHLDELPQLVNILRGDMSVVGPRPEAFEFARDMARRLPLYDVRYLVRPGLTGHAQINQGYALDNVAETRIKLAYDFYYLRHRSTWMDVQIISRTLISLTHRSR